MHFSSQLLRCEMDTILNYFFVISSNHQVPTSNHTFRLPAVRVTLLPPSSSSFRQLQLFQWIDHNVFVTSYSPATRTSFASFTPSVNAPGDQRGRGTFQGPPDTRPPSATVCADEHLMNTWSEGQSKAGTCNISLFRNLEDCVTLQF